MKLGFELFFTLKSLIIVISDKVSAYGDFFSKYGTIKVKVETGGLRHF